MERVTEQFVVFHLVVTLQDVYTFTYGIFQTLNLLLSSLPSSAKYLLRIRFEMYPLLFSLSTARSRPVCRATVLGDIHILNCQPLPMISFAYSCPPLHRAVVREMSMWEMSVLQPLLCVVPTLVLFFKSSLPRLSDSSETSLPTEIFLRCLGHHKQQICIVELRALCYVQIFGVRTPFSDRC